MLLAELIILSMSSHLFPASPTSENQKWSFATLIVPWLLGVITLFDYLPLLFHNILMLQFFCAHNHCVVTFVMCNTLFFKCLVIIVLLILFVHLYCTTLDMRLGCYFYVLICVQGCKIFSHPFSIHDLSQSVKFHG